MFQAGHTLTTAAAHVHYCFTHTSTTTLQSIFTDYPCPQIWKLLSTKEPYTDQEFGKKQDDTKAVAKKTKTSSSTDV